RDKHESRGIVPNFARIMQPLACIYRKRRSAMRLQKGCRGESRTIGRTHAAEYNRTRRTRHLPKFVHLFLDGWVFAVGEQQSSEALRLFSAFHFINLVHARRQHFARWLDSTNPPRFRAMPTHIPPCVPGCSSLAPVSF